MKLLMTLLLASGLTFSASSKKQSKSKRVKNKRSIASMKKASVKRSCLGETVEHKKFGYIGHCYAGKKGFLILEINKKLYTFEGVKRSVYGKLLKSPKKFSFYKKRISGRYKFTK